MIEPPDVLLIEDSLSQAVRFQLALQRAGYRTMVVTDGAEGWRKAAELRPRLVLLDIELPSMDGFQVLMRLKRSIHTRSIPVVMLTDREHISHVMRAIELGADGYLPKQDAILDLPALVEPYLSGSSGSSGTPGAAAG